MHLTVVTPTHKIVQDLEVSEVTVPGYQGQLQILPQHTELMSTLETGILSYKDLSGHTHYVAVSFGYLEVDHDKISVLAHTAEDAETIDIERAKASLKKAKELLGGGAGHAHFRKYELKVQRALARIDVKEKKGSIPSSSSHGH